jgi:hypothetical protein
MCTGYIRNGSVAAALIVILGVIKLGKALELNLEGCVLH